MCETVRSVHTFEKIFSKQIRVFYIVIDRVLQYRDHVRKNEESGGNRRKQPEFRLRNFDGIFSGFEKFRKKWYDNIVGGRTEAAGHRIPRGIGVL